jgi:hypothetical protein
VNGDGVDEGEESDGSEDGGGVDDCRGGNRGNGSGLTVSSPS